MTIPARFLCTTAVLAFSLLACGGDDSSSSNGANGTNGTNGATDDARCISGCRATIVAGCENGPAAQVACQDDCNRLLTGACGSEYDAYLGCAEDESVTCSEAGMPTVEACSSQELAFLVCLNP